MSNSANFKIDTSGIVNAAGDEDMAAGDIKFWPSEVIPGGWIVRDGRALSRATYAALFAVLGTRYGAGDGATTFNIMDDRAEYLRGADMGRGVDVGRAVGSLQSQQIPHHGHVIECKGGGSGFGFQATAAGRSPNGGTLGGVLSDIRDYAGAGFGADFGEENRVRNRAYVPLIKY